LENTLKSIFQHTIRLVESQSINLAEKNIEILHSVLKEILEHSISPGKSKLYTSTINYLDVIYTKLFEEGFVEKGIKNINKAYEILNKDKKVQVYFTDAMHQLIARLKEQEYFDEIYLYPIHTLLYQIVNNTRRLEGRIVDNNIPILITELYEAFNQNRFLNFEQKKSLIDNLVIDVLNFKLLEKSDVVTEITYSTLVNLLLRIISNKDKASLSNVNEVIESKRMDVSEPISFCRIYLTVAIYLYYLSYKEDLVANDRKAYKDMIQENKTLFNEILEVKIDDYWIYYKQITSELKKWEIMSLEAKWMVMESVVREFFLFLTIINQNVDLEEISIDILDEKELFPFINSYLNRNEISIKLKENFREFLNSFVFTYRDVEAYLEQLKLQLFSKYKYLRYEEVRLSSEKRDEITRNLNSIKNNIFKGISDLPVISLMNPTHSEKEIEHVYFTQVIEIPVYFLSNNRDNFKSLYNPILRKLESDIIRLLKDYGFVYKHISASDTHKVKVLLGLVEEFRRSKGIKINTFISGVSSDSYLLYNETPLDKNNLTSFMKSVSNFAKLDSMYWIGFDNASIKLDIYDVDVLLVERTEEQLLEKMQNLEKDNNQYLINVTNEIYLPFAKEEAKQFLKLRDVRFSVKFNVSLITKVSNPGFIIDIRYRKD
jgi:hypothetical protein